MLTIAGGIILAVIALAVIGCALQLIGERMAENEEIRASERRSRQIEEFFSDEAYEARQRRYAALDAAEAARAAR